MNSKVTDDSSVEDRIRTTLQDSPDLVAAYFFGSTARERAHALSDVDVAVLFAPELSAEAMFARTLEIGAMLDAALRRAVDVIALNRASPVLCFQVLKHGRCPLTYSPRRLRA